MSVSSTHSCSRCGTTVPANMAFCSNCGAPLNAGVARPGNSAHNGADFQFVPPPPPGSYTPPTVYQPQAAQGSYPPPGQQGYPPPAQRNQQLPAPSKPPKNASRSVLRQIGCGVGLVILLILVVLGAAGYFLVRSLGSSVTNRSTLNANATPTQAPIRTTPINATITYSGVAITIVNAQQATSFADDSITASPGALRLNLHESQSAVDDTGVASNVDPYYTYGKAFNVLLPGGRSVAPVGTLNSNGPTKGKTQTNWIDFPVPTSMNVNQLILRIGTDTEVQMDIALTGHTDLSQYQPRQVSPNTRVAYGPMFWTLTTASIQLSDDGKQADKGMRFIVVTLKIENPSTQDLHTYPPDYVRLQAGGGTIAPEGNTAIPLQFAAGTTNTTGSAAFLVPENETSFTLILLANGSTGADKDASINFQIP